MFNSNSQRHNNATDYFENASLKKLLLNTIIIYNTSSVIMEDI